MQLTVVSITKFNVTATKRNYATTLRHVHTHVQPSRCCKLALEKCYILRTVHIVVVDFNLKVLHIKTNSHTLIDDVPISSHKNLNSSLL